jgi:hypothetical protein
LSIQFTATNGHDKTNHDRTGVYGAAPSVPALRHARDELGRAIAGGDDTLRALHDIVEDLLVEAIQRERRPIHPAQLELDEVTS